MKVGKEEIVGLVVALKRFLSMDTDEEEARQLKILQSIKQRVDAETSARTELLDQSQSPRAYPNLLIYPGDGSDSNERLTDLINRLIEGDPRLAVSQNFMHLGAIGLVALSMRSDQADAAAERLVQELA